MDLSYIIQFNASNGFAKEREKERGSNHMPDILEYLQTNIFLRILIYSMTVQQVPV